MADDLKKFIRDVPDFPKPGIIFKDITPLLSSGKTFKKVITTLAKRYKTQGVQKIVAVDARGFIFGAALAHALGTGFVPIRKKGKLPFKTLQETYELEYGADTVEIHQDAIGKGERVVVLDDVLATGGTLAATCRLVEKLEAEIVEVVTIIELGFLKGREKLKKYKYFTMIVY